MHLSTIATRAIPRSSTGEDLVWNIAGGCGVQEVAAVRDARREGRASDGEAKRADDRASRVARFFCFRLVFWQSACVIQDCRYVLRWFVVSRT
ncbi:unnamed protein product [Ectocarpus sp. 8 AP-2014]